jgi:AcrR family transcriptional regulator
MTPRGEQRRRQILDQALEEFARRGYHETGVADIAQALSMSHGTFYRYFESKRSILDEVVDDVASRVRAALAENVDAVPFAERVAQAAAALAGVVTSDPRIARVLLFEAMGVDDALRGRVLALIDGFRGTTADALRAGIDSGELRSDLDPEETARAINGLLYAGALASVREGHVPAGYVDAALALLERGIRV